MAVQPLNLPGYAAPQTLDFSSLANLGEVYKKSSQDTARRDALSLANLGQGGDGYAKAIGSLAALGDLDGAAKVAAIQKTVAPESSADIQAFKMAQGQGFQGGILDFMKQKAEAGAARTNVNTVVQSGEKEYDKALNKDLADNFLNFQKGGRNASGAINTLNYMENLTKDPNFYSGAGGDLATKGKQALASMGVTAPDSAKPNELFGALSNKLTLDAAGGSLGAQISNSDVKFLQAINPNLATTPEGNRELIGYHRKVYERQQQTAKMARDYASKNGGRIDAGFDQVLQDYAEKNPLFPKQQGVGSTSANPAQPRGAPQSQAAPRQAPDGNFYVPDPARPGKYLRVDQ